MSISRRKLIIGAATVAATATAPLVTEGLAQGQTAPQPPSLPAPQDSGIDHIVVVMMENRSFDHYLGWLPGADGKQAGLTYTDRDGVAHATHRLDTAQGCAYNDPDHSYEGGRIEYNDGRCDGWLRAGTNDEFSIGYYLPEDLDFYSRAAPAWTVCDRYFSAVMAETYPNRFYQHAAQTDRIHNSTDTSTLPTIWDRLADAGLDGKYYYHDVPFTALWGTKHIGISHPYTEFLADCASGNLPQVSFVDPKFLDEGSGTSADDHPHGDIRAGQYFLNEVYHAVTSSPAWKRTLLVVNYDEWGGFFDHVAPATAPDAHPEWGLRGFRTPCLVISPRARRGYVAHGVYDHTSVLKAMEWRWNLPALTPRDAAANNIVEVLDFSDAPNPDAPQWSVPPVVGTPCSPAVAPDYEQWHALRDKAQSLGWKLPS
ncbi:alkaline phosphatase family protein [Streptomyces tropicalis]|uniref:phospholipase C n=1 Tax=Streptomyces tropicalis TaxID=3034234 RepID=A0ABT6AAY6_9ACTN|nr:alkaline phosphatase family protein [Streptomyces tropicalis]MDF3301796.1 alkaline phosphatase family protein [Streptomyces tropicalis]